MRAATSHQARWALWAEEWFLAASVVHCWKLCFALQVTPIACQHVLSSTIVRRVKEFGCHQSL